MSNRLNRELAGPAWGPHDFRGLFRHGRAATVESVSGYARRCFAVFCPEALGIKPDDPARPVLIVYLPIGQMIGPGCRHGAQAFRLCDALLYGFPEFEAVNMAGITKRTPEVVEVMRKHGVIK